MLGPFFDNIRVSLLRNIRIPQNLGNRFAHAFASCTRPSRNSRLGQIWLRGGGVVLNNGRWRRRVKTVIVMS